MYYGAQVDLLCSAVIQCSVRDNFNSSRANGNSDGNSARRRMSVIEQSVASQEIIVPPSLPIILKQFCKAAIRTQPYDLLKWSRSYFRALADGEEPPTKLRLEYPPPSTASGLTLGFLRILLRQFGGIDTNV